VVDPRRRRLSALADGLTAAHVDGLLVTSLPNIRYLTGFSGSSALLFVSGRDVVLVTDFRYQTQIASEVGDLARISIEPQSLWVGLWQQLSTLATFSDCSRRARGGSGARRWTSWKRCASGRTRESSP
jgi:Xaa-Pro aminopeptidase